MKKSISVHIPLVILTLFTVLNAAHAVVPVAANVAKNPAEVGTPVHHRTAPTTVSVKLTAQEVIAEIAPKKLFHFWTFNGTVPGPMIRAMEGDVLDLTLCNDINSVHSHNTDFHAVMGPGGGAAVTNVKPGECKNAMFKLLRAGAYIYHCAAEGKPWEHISHGMYGLIMVEPAGGLPTGFKEFYVGLGEWYLTSTVRNDPKVADTGVFFHGHDETTAQAEHPDFYTFNGHTQALTAIWKNLMTIQGDKARFFVVNGGPNIGANWHIIGTIFDKVYKGHPASSEENEETVYVAPGSGEVFELSTPVPGRYLLVDHALYRVPKGALGFLNVEPTVASSPGSPPPPWPLDIYSPQAGEMWH
jgi:nitrite reductase (NO-forming)